VIAKTERAPAAGAVVDANQLDTFLRRFWCTGIPSVWNAGCVVRVTLHGFDGSDTCRQ
jgi:hypothetical protein